MRTQAGQLRYVCANLTVHTVASEAGVEPETLFRKLTVRGLGETESSDFLSQEFTVPKSWDFYE